MDKDEQQREIESIAKELHEKPYLLEFMKKCIKLTEEQQKEVLRMLLERADK